MGATRGAAQVVRRAYHHGDLRRALIAAALEAVEADGAANLRLRDVARRAGVSHAAPAHHFGDKAGLLTAIAADGYELLASALREAYARTGSFLEVGVAYVTFATEQRSHFEVMFRPELYDGDNPEVAAAKGASVAALHEPLGGIIDPLDPSEITGSALAAWSLVHGLATLLLTDNLPTHVASDPQSLTRHVAAYLSFTPPSNRDE